MKNVTTLGLVALLLAACGGGDDSPPPAATAEGFWGGTASNGAGVAVAILENGETWGVYTSNNTLVGALYGTTTSSGTTLSGSGRDFNIPARTVTAGTYTGTFAAKSKINVTMSSGGTFAGTYDPSYDQPASLSALAGTFSGQGVSGSSTVQAAAVTISSSGAITVPGSSACSATGNAIPRPSNKNIFNVTITFAGTACALGNGTSTSGVAYYDASTRQVLVMAMNPSKSDGFIYVGQK